MPALLGGRQLVSKCTPASRRDERLGQLECVQHASESGFRVGNDRREVIDVAGIVGILPSIHWI